MASTEFAGSPMRGSNLRSSSMVRDKHVSFTSPSRHHVHVPEYHSPIREHTHHHHIHHHEHSGLKEHHHHHSPTRGSPFRRGKSPLRVDDEDELVRGLRE